MVNIGKDSVCLLSSVPVNYKTHGFTKVTVQTQNFDVSHLGLYCLTVYGKLATLLIN